MALEKIEIHIISDLTLIAYLDILNTPLMTEKKN